MPPPGEPGQTATLPPAEPAAETRDPDGSVLPERPETGRELDEPVGLLLGQPPAGL